MPAPAPGEGPGSEPSPESPTPGVLFAAPRTGSGGDAGAAADEAPLHAPSVPSPAPRGASADGPDHRDASSGRAAGGVDPAAEQRIREELRAELATKIGAELGARLGAQLGARLGSQLGQRAGSFAAAAHGAPPPPPARAAGPAAPGEARRGDPRDEEPRGAAEDGSAASDTPLGVGHASTPLKAMPTMPKGMISLGKHHQELLVDERGKLVKSETAGKLDKLLHDRSNLAKPPSTTPEHNAPGQRAGQKMTAEEVERLRAQSEAQAAADAKAVADAEADSEAGGASGRNAGKNESVNDI